MSWSHGALATRFYSSFLEPGCLDQGPGTFDNVDFPLEAKYVFICWSSSLNLGTKLYGDLVDILLLKGWKIIV